MNRHSTRRLAPSALLGIALTSLAAPILNAEDLSTSSGPQLYRQFCASCHGKNAEGNGPVAPFFKLLPPDLTLIARRSGGTFPTERIRRIVDGREALSPHGAREMPVWGIEFAWSASDPRNGQTAADTAITRLVEYLRSIQKAPPG